MNIREKVAEVLYGQWHDDVHSMLEACELQEDGGYRIPPQLADKMLETLELNFHQLQYLQKIAMEVNADTVMSVIDTQDRVSYWRTHTFPHTTVASTLAHLYREFEEFRAEPDKFEAADIVILLMGYAHLAGFNLLQAVEDKFEEVQHRTWGPPDSEGVSTRVRE